MNILKFFLSSVGSFKSLQNYGVKSKILTLAILHHPLAAAYAYQQVLVWLQVHSPTRVVQTGQAIFFLRRHILFSWPENTLLGKSSVLNCVNSLKAHIISKPPFSQL